MDLARALRENLLVERTLASFSQSDPALRQYRVPRESRRFLVHADPILWKFRYPPGRDTRSVRVRAQAMVSGVRFFGNHISMALLNAFLVSVGVLVASKVAPAVIRIEPHSRVRDRASGGVEDPHREVVGTGAAQVLDGDDGVHRLEPQRLRPAMAGHTDASTAAQRSKPSAGVATGSVMSFP